MRTLFRSFRQDKLLGFMTLAMTLVCLAPFAATSILPFIDLPHHVALSALLWDLAFGQGSAPDHYLIDPLPTPYWTGYVLLAVSMRAFGVYWGTKVVVAFCMLSVPLGVMRLLVALGRNPRMGTLAFLAVWDLNLTYGWINHVLGAGIAFFALAEFIDADTPRKAMRVWPFGMVLALTHVLPFGFFGLAALLVTLVRPGSRTRAIGLFMTAVSAPTLMLVPWLARSLGAGPRVDPGFVFDSLEVKLQKLFEYSLGFAHITPQARAVAIAAFVTVVIVPVAFAFFPKKLGGCSYRLAAVPFVTALILYFTLPLAVARPVEHWGTYPRFCTPMLLGLLFLPKPRIVNRHVFLLAPALFVGAILSSIVFRQFRAFDAAIAPFYEVAQKVPRGAKLLPLCYQNNLPMVRLPMGESLHGYIVANAGVFNPYLFGQATLPVHRKTPHEPPAVPGWGRYPKFFSMRLYGQFYDYILVQGTTHDPVRVGRSVGKNVELVFERGTYRLYAVK